MAAVRKLFDKSGSKTGKCLTGRCTNRRLLIRAADFDLCGTRFSDKLWIYVRIFPVHFNSSEWAVMSRYSRRSYANADAKALWTIACVGELDTSECWNVSRPTVANVIDIEWSMWIIRFTNYSCYIILNLITGAINIVSYLIFCIQSMQIYTSCKMYSMSKLFRMLSWPKSVTKQSW